MSLSARCGWCNVTSHMTLVPSTHRRTKSGDIWEVHSCDNCEGLALTFYPVFGEQILSPIWTPANKVVTEFPDVPDVVASAGVEAYQCATVGALRAAVQMARAVIEASAKNMGMNNGSLMDKIDALHERGLIRAYVQEAAHEIRHLGNEMAHGDFVTPVSEEDVKLILTLMSEVLNEIFQAPARVEHAKAARAARSSSTQDRPTV